MRIDAGGLYPTHMNADLGTDARVRRTQATPSDAGPDTVSVSEHARLLAAARSALEATGPVRDAVVADARERLAAGADRRGSEVAAAMISTITEGRV